MRKALTILILIILLLPQWTEAQTVVNGTERRYTIDDPLVYEDEWDKWPYAFINDAGEPTGLNVEMVSRIMNRLDIPYVVHLTDQERMHDDLVNAKADLTLCVNSSYNAPYGRFGKVRVTYSENAILQARKDSVGPYTIDDLRKMHLTVKRDSRAYFYVTENQFTDSLITCIDDMEEEILRMATEQTGTVMWNKMMLKWVINKYKLRNVAISSITDLPLAPYNFMSSDTLLLSRIDSVCREMQRSGEIEEMNNRWLHPEENVEEGIETYYRVTAMVIFFVIIIVLIVIYYIRKSLSKQRFRDISINMNHLLSSNNITVWAYDPQTGNYSWVNNDGVTEEEYTSFKFANFYPDTDFGILHRQVLRVVESNSEDTEIRVVRCYSRLEPEKILDVEVMIHPMKDNYGNIYLVYGVQHDITESKSQVEKVQQLYHRQTTAFNLALGTIIRFDANGRMTDINERGCRILGIRDKAAVIEEGLYFNDIKGLQDVDIATMPDELCISAYIPNGQMHRFLPISHFTRYNPNLEELDDFFAHQGNKDNVANVTMTGYYYVHVVKVYGQSEAAATKGENPRRNLIGVTLFVTDITSTVDVYQRLKRMKRHTQQLEEDKLTYKRRLNHTLQSNYILMFRYNPVKRTITFRDSQSNTKVELSQPQLLRRIDHRWMRHIFNALGQADSHTKKDIHFEVLTRLRTHNRMQRHFVVDVHPVYDQKANVASYFGICHEDTDAVRISDLLRTAMQTAHENEKLRKNFLRNMSYAIRQPLVAMRKNIKSLANGSATKDEDRNITNIKEQTDKLIKYSDDTMMLSRLEGGLVAPLSERIDFVKLFREVTTEITEIYQSDNVEFQLENPYDTLEFLSDPNALYRILKESISLAARHIQFGTLRVRYLYRRESLTISIQDNGQGIPPAILEKIYEQGIGSNYTASQRQVRLSGLEMPICRKLVELLQGTIEIDSDQSSGTSIYIYIPIRYIAR